MMSRILLSISLVCLLAVSSGLTLNVHFCMNQVAGVSFFSSADHHCNFCGMQEDSDGCCHQEKQLVKLSQDQYPPHFFNYSVAPAAAFVLPLEMQPSKLLTSELLPFNGVIHAPPDKTSVPLFISNRVFRI